MRYIFLFLFLFLLFSCRKNTVVGLTKEESMAFSQENGMDSQEAYDLLVSHLKGSPFIENKAFVINNEFFFVFKKARLSNYIFANGYAVDPKTKKVYRKSYNKKLVFSKGTFQDNGIPF